MKFNTWQFIALAALILAAVILSHVFAPGSVAFVTSVAGALVGLLVSKKDGGDPPAGSGDGGANLKVIAGGLSLFVVGFLTAVAPVLAIVALATGCGPSYAEIEKIATGSGETTPQIRSCANESRDAFYRNGKSEDEAIAVYQSCIARADAGNK